DARTANGLANMGCATLTDTTRLSASELLTIPNFGKVSLDNLRDVLASQGLALKGESGAASGFIPAEIRQSRGPILEFEGRPIACTEWTTKGHDPTDMKLELWQTRGGALIAVTRS